LWPATKARACGCEALTESRWGSAALPMAKERNATRQGRREQTRVAHFHGTAFHETDRDYSALGRYRDPQFAVASGLI
jgi:hypothetical protein